MNKDVPPLLAVNLIDEPLTPSALADACDRITSDLAPMYWSASDDERFQVLLKEAEPTVRSLLGRMSRDREITEDAYQKACIRAWVAFHQYRPPSKFSTWLCTIARRELAGIMRLSSTKHEGQNVALHDDYGKLLYDQAPPPADAEEPDSLSLAVIVERARQTRLGFVLDDVDVEILRLRARGLKVKEIADAVDLTYGAAKTRLYKAVVKLRLMAAANMIQQHPENFEP